MIIVAVEWLNNRIVNCCYITFSFLHYTIMLQNVVAYECTYAQLYGLKKSDHSMPYIFFLCHQLA